MLDIAVGVPDMGSVSQLSAEIKGSDVPESGSDTSCWKSARGCCLSDLLFSTPCLLACPTPVYGCSQLVFRVLSVLPREFSWAKLSVGRAERFERFPTGTCSMSIV